MLKLWLLDTWLLNTFCWKTNAWHKNWKLHESDPPNPTEPRQGKLRLGLCVCQTKNPMQRWVQQLVSDKYSWAASTKANNYRPWLYCYRHKELNWGRQPPLNNSHFLWAPRVVVVYRFDTKCAWSKTYLGEIKIFLTSSKFLKILKFYVVVFG